MKHTPSARRGLGSRDLVQRQVGLPEVKQGRKSRPRGFAAMDPMLQRRIARQGGRTVSRDRKHMAEIGRIGGERSHRG
jgi:uncharacterized protein